MSANRHEPAAQRGLEAVSGPTAGVTGTSVPRHSDPIHDHWDEAYALGYLRGYADGRDDGRLVALDAAREAVAALPPSPLPERWGIRTAMNFRGDVLAAIDALREETK